MLALRASIETENRPGGFRGNFAKGEIRQEAGRRSGRRLQYFQNKNAPGIPEAFFTLFSLSFYFIFYLNFIQNQKLI